MAVAGLTATSLGVRTWWLGQTPHPTGLDGYYYVVQLADWHAGLGLHVPDSSWVLPFLGELVGLAGGPIAAQKLGAATLAAACLPAAWLLGRTHSAALGWALAAWALASPTLTHLAGDFPKNLGLVAPLLCLCALVRHRPRAGHIAAGLVALALTLTAHRLGAALLLAGGAGAFLGGLLRRRPAPSSAKAWLVPVGLLGTIGLFSAASLVLPGLLHPADLARLEGQLSLSAGLPSPLPWAALRQTHPLQLLELSLPWAVLVLCGWRALRSPTQRPAAFAGLVILGLIYLVPWRRDVLDLGYRLALMGPVVAVALLPSLLPPRRPRLPTWTAVALPLAVAAAPTGLDPDAHPDYDRYDALIAAIPRPLPTLLIAHQGINFLYDHRTGEEAMAWAPEPELDPTTVGRLVWGITDAEWRALADAPQGRLDADYRYATEPAWQAFLTRARLEGDDDLRDRLTDPRNPSVVRPSALTRGR